MVVLLSPVLCALLRRRWGIFTLLLLGILFVLKIQTPFFGLGGGFIGTLLFFSAGAWLALHRICFARVAQRHLPWTLPLWLILIALCTRFDSSFTSTGLIFHPWMQMLGVAAFAGLIARWHSASVPRPGTLAAFVADNTFFIYLAHSPWGLMIAGRVVGLLPLPTAASYLLAPFVNIAVCVAALWLMKRYIPRTTALLTGEWKKNPAPSRMASSVGGERAVQK